MSATAIYSVYMVYSFKSICLTDVFTGPTLQLIGCLDVPEVDCQQNCNTVF